MAKSFLVIDSGSTKADWLHYPSFTRETTKGFNPFYYKTLDIINELKKHIHFLNNFYETEQIFWYGSGCSNLSKNKIIYDALKYFFPKSEIFVEHDLLGSARALLGNQKGIACILGTGSNSCLYDGKDIIQNIPSLGFFLGDEGSSTHIGKKFLCAYFYGELSQETHDKFYALYHLERNQFLNDLHQSQQPNLMIAQFTPFLSENIYLQDIRRIVKDSFREFFNHHASRYKGFHELPIAFTGSVANAFQDILLEVVEEWNGNFLTIIKNPIDALSDYHQKHKIFNFDCQ